MTQIITFHSFRGGTGKSTIVANLGALLAAQGQRVCVMDFDIQAPGLHLLYGPTVAANLRFTLNDYLVWGKCTSADTAFDVTPHLGDGIDGKLFLCAASLDPGEISQVLKDGYEISLLLDAVQELNEALNLGMVLIDTHSGLQEEAVITFGISDQIMIVLRPDAQNMQGTESALSIIQRLRTPPISLVVNQIPDGAVHDDIEARFGLDVSGLLPHTTALISSEAGGQFALQAPNEKFSKGLTQLAGEIVRAG